MRLGLNKLIILSTFCFLVIGKAQITDSVKVPSSISINAKLILSSSSLRNNFLRTLAFGGKIENKVIEDNLNKTNNTLNSLGFISKYEARYNFKRLKSDTNNWKIGGFTYSFNEYKSLGFNKDAFKLLFIGNAKYVGETLNLKNNVYATWSEHVFKTDFLIQKYKKKYSLKITSVSAGLGVLTNYSKIKIKTGSIYTDSMGDFIQSNLNGFVDKSNSSSNLKGFSLLTGLTLKYKNRCRIQISNIGVAFLTNVKRNTSNANIKIEQTTLEQIGFTNTAWLSQKRDSFKNIILPEATVSNKIILSPFQISIQDIYVNHKLLGVNNNMFLNLTYFYFPAFLPQLTINQEIFKHHKIYISSSLRYGGFAGYSQVDLDFDFSFRVNKNKNISLHLYSVEGLLNSTNRGGGIGLHFFSVLN